MPPKRKRTPAKKSTKKAPEGGEDAPVAKKLKTSKEGQTNAPKKTKKSDGKVAVNELPEEMKQISWRELSFIGIEEGADKSIFEEQWEFPELEEALKSGFLSKLKHPVYVFLGAQPINKGKGHVADLINVPYIVVIDCAVPLSELISSSSIQNAAEQVLPMKAVRVCWAPYRPKGFRDRPELPPQFYYISMETRRAVKKNLNEQKLHSLSFLLPYELLPQMFEKESLEEKVANVRQVDFTYKAKDGRSVQFVWDKDIHRLKTDLPSMMQEEKIPEAEEEAVKEKLKEAFDKKREEVTKEHEAKKKRLDALPPEHINALRNIKLYKFYPTHPKIVIHDFMVPDINRYFGQADRIFPELRQETSNQTN